MPQMRRKKGKDTWKERRGYTLNLPLWKHFSSKSFNFLQSNGGEVKEVLMLEKILTEIRNLIREYDPQMENCKQTVLRTHALISKMVEDTGEKHGIKASYDPQSLKIKYAETEEDVEKFLQEVGQEIYQLYYTLYNDLVLIFLTNTKTEN